MDPVEKKKILTILDRWEVTADELTELVDLNPSLRGMILGYLAEIKLRHTWFAGKEITKFHKYDDHDRKNKGDLHIIYKDHEFKIEVKSLQTNSIKQENNIWKGKAQCDASDRRVVTFKDGTTLETTCLLRGEFDLLAINLFAFENKWKFAFIKNKDLPASRFRKYSDAQRECLLASLVDVSWPPLPPFKDEPFTLLDEIIRDRAV